MTPARAIRINCRFCNGGSKSAPKCTSKHCSCNRRDMSAMDRIQRGCQECAADHRPEACTGRLVGVQRKILAETTRVSLEEAICPLHPYRMGKNPNLSWKRSEGQKNEIIERTRAYRLKRKETLSHVKRIERQAGAKVEK